ncbi:hypothetical protein RRG08_021072 [Elysia crispata]|uniref:Uncharacterized protein n=1 Tax=Elysia crispata TaxID=231223 RepID=A0AAE1AKG4_9GAST|nr:hypothetical protein RRG08_021072 [Elysia crispata]
MENDDQDVRSCRFVAHQFSTALPPVTACQASSDVSAAWQTSQTAYTQGGSASLALAAPYIHLTPAGTCGCHQTSEQLTLSRLNKGHEYLSYVPTVVDVRACDRQRLTASHLHIETIDGERAAIGKQIVPNPISPALNLTPV